MKKNLLIMDSGPTAMTYKLVYFLREHFNVHLISLSKRDKISEDDYKKLGIRTYFFDIIGEGYIKNKKILKGFKEIFKFLFTTIKYKFKLNKEDYVFARVGDNWVGEFLFKIFNKQKKMYFPYDICLFCWKNPETKRSKRDIKAEKYCFENADFILHKGPENELDLIKSSEAKIKGKAIQFLPYCFDKWMLPLKKVYKINNPPRLVFAGHFVYDNYLFKKNWEEVYKTMVNSGVKIDIFSLQNLEGFNHKNISLKKALSSNELSKEIAKYDYGLSVAFLKKENLDPRLLKTSMGNKIFSYLESGIPVIIDNDAKYIMEIVKKYKCGVVISEKDLSNLGNILKKQNYKKLLEGVKKAREELKLSSNQDRIIRELEINN